MSYVVMFCNILEQLINVLNGGIMKMLHLLYIKIVKIGFKIFYFVQNTEKSFDGNFLTTVGLESDDPNNCVKFTHCHQNSSQRFKTG